MATVVDQAKRGSPARYDGIVEAKLAKAQGRVRSLDTTTGLLGFVVLTLAYALVMAVLDRRFELALGVRQLAFVGYAGASLAVLWTFIARPWLRRVNPYYAARQIEQQLPSAKNSVVNWIDLHELDLPASIKGAVGQRAAQDLSKVNLEETFQGRHTVWLGVSTLGLGLAVFVLLIFIGFPQFLSLLRRAFVPYEGGVITKQTQILVKTCDTTVPVEQPATILVEVNGKVPDPHQPDAVRLLLRYRETDPYEDPILFDKVADDQRDWQAIVPASRVRNGFWYKVKGGDHETQEYRVGVRSSPLIKGFEAKLHYPKYTGWTDTGTYDPNLHDFEGADVTLIVHTNRTVRKGSLEFDLDKEHRSLAGAPIKDDPQAMLFRFVLEKSGTYGVRFASSEAEEYADATRYSLIVIPDRAPHAFLTEPGQDVTLPSNGALPLKGHADDDIGLTKMTLRLQVVDGQVLEARPYRQGKDFKLSDGSYPKMLEYVDVVDLAGLKDAQGNKAVIAEGQTIEYWLEAEDNHEPQHHIGESQHYKVTLAPPNKDTQKQQQQREQAEQNKKDHDKKQDNDLKKEGEQRQQQQKGSKGEDKGNPDPNNKNGNNPMPNDNAGGKPNPQDKQPNEQPQPNKPEAGDGSQGGGQPKDETKKVEEKLNDAKNGGQGDQKDQGGAQDKATAKDDPTKQPKGESKDKGKGEQSQKADAKDKGSKGDPNQQPAKQKDEGSPSADGTQDKAGSKQEGKPQPNEAKGDSKEQKGEKTESATTKGEGRPEAKPAEAADKSAGQGDPKDQTAAKSEGAKTDGQGQAAAVKEGKGEKADGKPEGIAKGRPPAVEKSEQKDGGGSGSQEAKAQAKDEKKGAGGQPKADDKPAKPDASAGAGAGKYDKLTDQRKQDLLAQRKRESQGAKPEDVSKLEKEAQGADGQKERDLLNKLSQMRQFADDPATKEAADKALDKMFEKMMARANSEKTKPGSEKSNSPEKKDASGTPKEPAAKNNPETTSDKGEPADKNNPSKDPKTDAANPSQPGDPKDPTKKPTNAGNPTGPTTNEKGEPDAKLSNPGTGEPDKPLTNQGASKPPEGGEGDPENLKKASQLQLENVRKLVKEHPDVLDKTGLSTEDLGRYFEAKQKQIAEYDRMAREKAEAKDQEAAGKTTGSFTNIGAQKLKRDDAKPGSTNTPGAGAPPPEFKDMYYKKFTKPKTNP